MELKRLKRRVRFRRALRVLGAYLTLAAFVGTVLAAHVAFGQVVKVRVETGEAHQHTFQCRLPSG